MSAAKPLLRAKARNKVLKCKAYQVLITSVARNKVLKCKAFQVLI